MRNSGEWLRIAAPALLNKEADLTILYVPDALVALEKWPGKLNISSANS
jgi:hypothetical protein